MLAVTNGALSRQTSATVVIIVDMWHAQCPLTKFSGGLHEIDDDAANWLNNMAMTAFAK